MSFRETRNLIEKLRALGYPKRVFVDSFRTPNFEMLADILCWLTKSYDPESTLTAEVGTESERIALIKAVATVMALKAHLRLNTRKLYSADGFAVQEMLKIASMLYIATSSTSNTLKSISEAPRFTIDSLNRAASIKECRQVANVLTEKGIRVYDALSNELESREIRNLAISRPLDLLAIEQEIRNCISKIRNDMDAVKVMLTNATADESNILSKIEKKKLDLDRRQKRLKSLQSVRPAYMDEFDRLEAELEKFYALYVMKFRNLAFLESQLATHHVEVHQQTQMRSSSLKKIQSKIREEEMVLLRGDDEFIGSDNDDDLEVEMEGTKLRSQPPQTNKGDASAFDEGSDDDLDDVDVSVSDAPVRSPGDEDDFDDQEQSDEDLSHPNSDVYNF